MSLVFGVLLLLGCAGFIVPLDFAVTLVGGWVVYLARVVPQVRIDWSGVAMGVICLILFSVGAHAFLDWLFRQTGESGGVEAPGYRHWKPRWTAAAAAVIVLMFVAGLSTAGLAHQVGWLLTSREPLVDGGPSVRAAARRVQSTNNLKQIGLGLSSYHEMFSTFPAGGTFDAEGRPLQSWQTRILPYVEQVSLYGRIDVTIPWNDPRNASAFQTEVSGFLNPGIPVKKDRAGYALSHYAGNAFVLGGDVPWAMRDLKDGSSVTLMGGEVAGGFRPWGDPVNWRDPGLGVNRSPAGFGGPFQGGANFLFADGTVRFLKNSIDPAVLKALGTPAGNEKVSPPD
jgi:prepilin-type processing-associated H-X9-DG protein